MVNVDISKVIPTRAYDYLSAFLPGLFFEVCILLANPDLVLRLATQPMLGFSAKHYYTSVIIVLFLGFAIGNGFLMFVTFIQYVLRRFYMLSTSLWRLLCKWPLKPLVEWFIKKPGARRGWAMRLHRYVVFTGFEGSDEWKKLQGCWGMFARRLLKVRYGIEYEDVGDDEWQVLYWALGSPTAEERRGNLMVIASEATGWAGLAATRIAPSLRNKYYLAFCAFMVFVGLLHDYWVAKRMADLRISGYINLRAVMREFSKLPTNPPPATENEPAANPGDAPAS